MLPLTRNRGLLAVFGYYMTKLIDMVKIDVLHILAHDKKNKIITMGYKILIFCLTVAYL